MALTMLDKKAVAEDRGEWPAELKAEFERESRRNNGCVGSQLLSETDKVASGSSGWRRASGSAFTAMC